MTPKLNSNTKGKGIWSLITVKQLAAAIASLDDRIKQLNKETWRLNNKTKLSTSLWAQVIEKLKIKHNEKIRHSLYNVWHLKRNNIDKLVEKESKRIGRNEDDGDDGDINEAEEISFTEKSIPNLPPDPSLPLPQRPNTRANKSENVDDNVIQNTIINEISLTLTPCEWKDAFSCTRQKMNDGWTKIFHEKLKSSGMTCVLCFRKSHVRKGKRKHTCKFFWCRATCTNSECTRSYFIILKNQPDIYTSALFLVRVSGIENHNAENETMRRQLRGEERDRVGK
jgi:hypothetical protein